VWPDGYDTANRLMLIRLKHCALDACLAHTVCVCILLRCEGWTLVCLSSSLSCSIPNHFTKLFSTLSTIGYGPRHVRFCQKQCFEIVNVIVIVPVTWSDKSNLSMSITSDFKVKIEKLDGPDDWRKWKWQILMLLRAHCLEGIIDGSRKCPVLPADAQTQQKRN